jgi:hypothetical protein
VSFICLTTAALVATAPLVSPAAVLAQPTQDIARPAPACAAAVHRDHSSRPPAQWTITFTNPACRSRGPGAGAGLL